MIGRGRMGLSLRMGGHRQAVQLASTTARQRLNGRHCARSSGWQMLEFQTETLSKFVSLKSAAESMMPANVGRAPARHCRHKTEQSRGALGLACWSTPYACWASLHCPCRVHHTECRVLGTTRAPLMTAFGRKAARRGVCKLPVAYLPCTPTSPEMFADTFQAWQIC